ncbi:hypothetical protein [Streptomyces sp. NPDC058620]|uniref:hypothetical protein n=1 Tax=Streptomyces sp. NPDC058620 TaxID=3346560 RepID=UPI0036518C4C
MPRLLMGSVRAAGKDFENFGSDEFLRDNHRDVRELLNQGDNESAIRVDPFKWGGECRIEVHLNAIALDSGVVQVHGFTSFFEGTSEDTPDERDRELLNFLVPRFKAPHDHPTVISAHMQSGPDMGDVTLSLTNTPAD